MLSISEAGLVTLAGSNCTKERRGAIFLEVSVESSGIFAHFPGFIRLKLLADVCIKMWCWEVRDSCIVGEANKVALIRNGGKRVWGGE